MCPPAPPPPPQTKTIVFVSTCKQVKFLFEALRKLRPGVPLRALHGKMNQYKRMGGERWYAVGLRACFRAPPARAAFSRCEYIHIPRTELPANGQGRHEHTHRI